MIFEIASNLSPTQHYSKAHPKNKTHVVDSDYQLICLLAKSGSIQTSLNKGEEFYNKGIFVFVINEGVHQELVEEQFGFDVIEQRLVHFYNANNRIL